MLKKIKSIIIHQRYHALLTFAYMLAGFECLKNKETIDKRDFVCALGFLFVESCLKLYYKNESEGNNNDSNS